MSIHKNTDAEFKEQVRSLADNEYTFLDNYINAKTKLRVRHNKCGNIYEVKPNNFLNGNRCPYCAGYIKKTDNEFKQEIYDLVGNEYTFLDPYVNSKTKLRVKHNKCGNIYKVTPDNFLMGRRCPYCSAEITNKTDTRFKKEVFNLVGNEYVFLDTYVNSNTKIKVKHIKCGKTYKVKPNNFLRGQRCPYCIGGNIKKMDKQFKNEVKNLVGNEYTFLDSYVNRETKIRVKHNSCGSIYEVEPGNFLSGTRCPYCNSPKGETIISKILDSLHIKYEYQKTFDDLRDTQPLSYDFFIPTQNILIEYQGQQHYQPIDHFGGKARFKIQHKHDKMKADYAKSNNYKLIAVPYTKDTFSKIKKYLIKQDLLDESQYHSDND